MATKKQIRKWLLYSLFLWLAIETGYQLHLRSLYVKNGIYQWETYALDRNKDKLRSIEAYFLQSPTPSFNYSRYPDQGSLNELPDSVKHAIESLNKDLTWGINLLKTRNNFEISFNKNSNEKLEIRIEAGANFKQSYNGYNFSALITNDSCTSTDHSKYPNYTKECLCIDKAINSHYRKPTLLLPYNANSYDLLILKPFR